MLIIKTNISLSERIFFIRQLAILLQSGIILIDALTTLILATTHPVLQKILVQIKADISSGLALSKALSKFPRYFSSLTCHLIHAGEQAAALPVVLDQLASYQEKMALLRARIQKALFYPAVVLTTALLISMGLILFIVPQFEQLFSNVGASLPWLTRMVIYCSEIIKDYGVLIILSVSIIILILYILAKKIRVISIFFENIYLNIPVFGLLQRQAIISRFARTLAMTYHAGVPLVDALLISADIADQSSYRIAILRVREAVMKGETFSHALQKTRQFSPLVIQMVRVGEQAGVLDEMLLKIADWYDQQIDYTVTTLSNILEPFIMIFLGVLIGGLVLAMYLPVFQLGTVV